MGEVAAASPWVLLYSYLLIIVIIHQYQTRDHRPNLHLDEEEDVSEDIKSVARRDVIGNLA